MHIAKTKLLGSNYIGLFAIANDSLCFVPQGIEERAVATIEKTLDVRTVKVSIYSSSLLAVFAKMNNKALYAPSFISPTERKILEKEIPVHIIPTENALGNLVELNDTGAILSKSLPKKVVESVSATGLATAHTNIAKTDVVGSSLVATTLGFVVNPNVSTDEATLITKTLGVNGGSASANTGDVLIHNSILANRNGILVGEGTTPHEIAKIEEALMGEA